MVDLLMRSSAMAAGIWWASQVLQVTTYESYQAGWLKSSLVSTEFVSCILAEEPSDGTLPVGFFDPPSPLRAIPSISSHSTFPGRVTTPSSVSYLASVRRLL